MSPPAGEPATIAPPTEQLESECVESVGGSTGVVGVVGRGLQVVGASASAAVPHISGGRASERGLAEVALARNLPPAPPAELETSFGRAATTGLGEGCGQRLDEELEAETARGKEVVACGSSKGRPMG